MAATPKRWIIKDSDGRIVGPFPTEKVLYKIGRGELSGDEAIALYPGGDWFPISQEPQFYDRLIDALAGHAAHEPDDDRDTQPTPIVPTNSQAPTEELEIEDLGETRKLPENENRPKRGRARHKTDEERPREEEKAKKPKEKRKSTRSTPEAVIELMDLGKLVKKERVKRIKIPVVLAMVILVVAAVIQIKPRVADDRIHLTALQSQGKPLGRDQLIDRIRRAQLAYTEGTFSGLQNAQNYLLQVIEGDEKNAPMLALLCLTYYELWPYAFQDSTDLRAVSIANQRVGSLDPAGANAATCRVVDLLVRGRLAEAKSMTESILDTYSATSNPPIPFYYFKAVLLADANEVSTAINYLNSAQQLSPRWLSAYVLEAELQGRVGNHTQAAKIYRHVLGLNPQHKIAKIQLGLIELLNFNHQDKGSALLQEALASGERAPPVVMSRAYLGMARIALMQRDNSQALKHAQKAFKFDSTNIEAKNLVVALGGKDKLEKTDVKSQQLVYEGDQYVREGDCNSAQAHYKSAWEMDKTNAQAAMKAATCMWQLSFSREAIEWLNRAIKSDPKLIDAYVTLADYYTQKYDFLSAARILAQAQRVMPNSYEVFRGYALVEYRRGNPKAAINYGEKALALYETDVETHILMSQAHLKIGGDRAGAEAYKHASKAIEIDINSRQAQIVYAQTLAATKGVELGLDYLTRLVTTYPLVIEYRMALGELNLKDERYGDAVQVFRQVIEIEEKSKKAWFSLGKSQRLLGENQAALESLLKAAVLDPSDTEPLFEAGLLYLEIKQPIQARTQFQRVLSINNRHPLVHYYMGRASLLMNDPKEALKSAMEERKINPNLADAYLLAAESQYLMNQHSLCVREYTQAIKLRPQGADTYVKLARCYRLMGSYDMGVQVIEQASKYDGSLPDLYRERGELFLAQGKFDEAAESFNQYFQMAPGAEDRKQIQDRLEALVRQMGK